MFSHRYAGLFDKRELMVQRLTNQLSGKTLASKNCSLSLIGTWILRDWEKSDYFTTRWANHVVNMSGSSKFFLTGKLGFEVNEI
jgi:hypothetical protein